MYGCTNHQCRGLSGSDDIVVRTEGRFSQAEMLQDSEDEEGEGSGVQEEAEGQVAPEALVEGTN